ncbi:MdtA/MuxA family multidrug efflux RND transporter periplasmic adaptor subunit [Sphingomonas nostoxanthinifaciens]|uniref:MdtA/MuxA family multidrug efflux RND transporter periplasmic adaptor subunit n=1 Tax=Sphingomonas nostoxanthinifaciens TaxID=2872652 RepID=UPI001CC1FDDE|nr:MdtA/MuxA family multidrug efflux RND transporter periplasmic adaptor subunit [Sphingomonas nostoxanthinifaciens]UAK26366.1 MdtA/MuxA family multidrug efflux RND transporter periplasmic adaptor subunit [Sphingomonas nostoxanthinifaciens]
MNDHYHAPTVSDAEALPARSPRSRRNALLVGIALVVVFALLWAITHSSSSADGAGGATGRRNRPSATVGIAKVVSGDMPVSLSAIGTVQPIVTATVRPQLSGNIFTINFTEGQVVAKGQLLAQIDPRPYRLALAQAQANLARDQAVLNLAHVDLQRYQTLLAQDSIARQQVQTQAATVKQDEGTVAADQAAIGTAKLNLQYTSITSPVSGRVGLRQVDIGNYVTPGDTTGIVVITQTTPIDVTFALPQVNLPTVLARRRAGDTLAVTATDQAGTTTLAEGRFLTFDNQIDATTGTVKAKARFPNPDSKLFPNQFVNASLLVDTLHNVAIVPVTAVRHGAQGDFVFVLQGDHTVKLQQVKLGPADGTRVAIASGVAAGQTVITEGADNLDDGSKVTLPGEKPKGPKRAQPGFFARLFGGGASADGGGSADAQGNAQGNAQSGQHHRRRSADGNGGGQ